MLYRSVDLYLYRLRIDTLHLSGSKGIKLLYLKRRLVKRILNPNDRLAERVREIRVQTMDTDPKSSDLATLVRVLLRLTNLKDFWYFSLIGVRSLHVYIFLYLSARRDERKCYYIELIN